MSESPFFVELGVLRPEGVLYPLGVFRPLLRWLIGETSPCGVKLFGERTERFGILLCGEGSRDPAREPALEFERDGLREGMRDPGRVFGRSVAVVLMGC